VKLLEEIIVKWWVFGRSSALKILVFLVVLQMFQSVQSLLQYTIYILHMYNIQYTIYVQYTMYNIQYTCAIYNIHVQYTIYNIQYTFFLCCNECQYLLTLRNWEGVTWGAYGHGHVWVPSPLTSLFGKFGGGNCTWKETPPQDNALLVSLWFMVYSNNNEHHEFQHINHCF
jgi:hypothetical protein